MFFIDKHEALVIIEEKVTLDSPSKMLDRRSIQIIIILI